MRRSMIGSLVALLLSTQLSVTAVCAKDYVFTGPWKTENRKLDGIMTCVVTPTAIDKWQGRFYGVWQGVDFDYRVDFAGPIQDVHGVATIDGAAYQWRGSLTRDKFRGRFDGDRYRGEFELHRQEPGAAASKRPDAAGAVSPRKTTLPERAASRNIKKT